MNLNHVLFLSAVMALALCSCNHSDNLPKEVQEVGGTIVKSEDVLAPSGIDFGAAQSHRSEKPAEIETSSTLDAEAVKEWLSPVVDSEYEKKAEGAYVAETADIKGGGVLEITSHLGNYYCTNVLYPAEDPEAAPKGAEALGAYIGRPLTSNETDELSEAVESVKDGAESVFLQNIKDSAQVYVMLQDSNIMLQIR